MKIPYITTKGMSREEWLEKRREGIGGSDAPGIMGESRWSSPLSVYADKRGLRPDREMTEPMRQGVDLEEVVARRFSEATNLKVRRVNRMYRHPEHTFMLANIDRQVLGVPGFEGLECKTTSLFNPADFALGEIPPVYYWQCMHYMAVTGAQRWHLAVLVLSKAFHHFVIPRDEAAVSKLIAAERAFWFDHVLAGVPPRPSGVDADEDTLRSIPAPEPLSGGGPADLSDILPDLDALDGLKARKSDLDRQIRASEQLIRLRIGASEEAVAGPWRISFRLQPHSSLDSAALKADHPDLYRRYTKSTPRRVLRIRNEWGKGEGA